MTLQELRERAAELANQIQRMAAEYNERRAAGQDLWPDDTETTWTTINREYDETLAAIEDAQQQADVAARAAAAGEWLERGASDRPQLDDPVHPLEPGTTYRQAGAEDRSQAAAMQTHRRNCSLAFQVWATRAVDGVDVLLSDEHHQAVTDLRFNADSPGLSVPLLPTEDFREMQRRTQDSHDRLRRRTVEDWFQQRALTSGIGASGGFVVPVTVLREIEQAQLAYAGMMQAADVITTTTGEPMPWPIVDDTANSGAYTDENQDESANTADPAFEAVTFSAHQIHSKFVKVPFRLTRDAFINLEQLIGQAIGVRIGRKLGAETTTGADKIRGAVTRAAAGQTAAATTAIVWADMAGLIHSIDPALRPNASWMFHDAVLEKVRLIQDGASQYIWQSNARDGLPDTIDGRRFYINQNMCSTVTASDKTMLFGDLAKYKIRRVGSIRIKRLVERFAEADQLGFIGYGEYDGNLLRPSAAASCPVKYLIQKAS